MKIKTALFAAMVIFIFLPLSLIFYTIFKSINYNALPLSLFFYTMGKLTGLIGFLFLTIIVFSGDTARFFDKFFGINKIILLQRKFALVVSMFILLHPIFFILSSGSFSYLIPSFSIIPLGLGAISLYLFIIFMTASILAKRIPYKIWQYLHILSYLLYFFSLYHAIKLGSDYNFLPIKAIFFMSPVLVLIGMVYRTQYKIKQMFSDKFYVKEIIREAKDAFTLVLESEKRLSFKAGQFCFLRLNKKGIYARHPFTIASSPEEKDLKFTIKINGRFSREALNLKKGEEIMVEGPFGIFTLEDTLEGRHEDVVFIAGGVGITPFMSMIRFNANSTKRKNITLFYCSKKAGEIIYKAELDKIRGKWLRKVYIVSEDECPGSVIEKGFMTKSIVKKYLTDKKLKNAIFYICGPEKMKNSVTKTLRELGIKKEDVITEDFFW